MEFGVTRNLMDVQTQYEILRFCGLGLKRLKFCRTKTWDMMSKKSGFKTTLDDT
jgi:hypothetical protein